MKDKYTVIWRQYLIETKVAEWVATAWQQGKDSKAITDAMNKIDRVLSTDPEMIGESRRGGIRVLIVPPLTVYFEIHEEEKIVLIISAVLHS